MKHFHILLMLLICNFCNAQKYDYNWVFGDSVGIDFSNLNSPTVFSTNFDGTGVENYSSISDANGNLMFYISGFNGSWAYSYVYNKLGQLMEGGDSIPSHRSLTQGSLIIPFINDSSKYYLIYLVNTILCDIPHGLYYAVIDMSKNGGVGKVISKNNLIYEDEDLSEKLIATKHGNGRDWWILTHYKNTSDFIETFLSPAGFSLPSSQSIGLSYSGIGYGQMIFSPSGNKLCSVSYGTTDVIDYFDFDRCTGLLTNYVDLSFTDNGSVGYYGCSFSPDGSKLYASNMMDNNSGFSNSKLYQFNLNASSIFASKTLIFETDSNYIIGSHLLGPNHKIYFGTVYSSGPNNIYSVNNMSLNVISYPDSVGTSCNLLPHSFYLGGKRILFGLPNMANYRLGALQGSACDTLFTSTYEFSNTVNDITIAPNPFKTNTTITFTEMQKNTLIKINDTFGNEMKRVNFTGTQLMIEKEKLKAGIYFVQIIDEHKNICTKKIVVY